MAQICYTVPFTLVHTGKYRTEDKLKYRQITQTKRNPEKAKKNTTKPNYHSLVAFYDTQPGNEVNLFYNTPEPTRGSHGSLLCLVDSDECRIHHQSPVTTLQHYLPLCITVLQGVETHHA